MLLDDPTADALALAAAMRRGEFTPRALYERVRERVAALNPDINAVVAEWEPEEPGADPGAPFHGIPLLLKDLLAEAEGTPLTMGSALLRGHRCERDSPLVSRLRAAGFRPFGRTSVPEFGYLPVTEPRAHGPCRNPWDPTRTPGGSSGGAAAAVAAGIVPLAHGTDAGGSLRVPASCCGLFALKPSRDRVPLAPEQRDALGGLTAEHVITRSVRDCAAVLAVTSGAPSSVHAAIAAISRPPPPLRILVVTRAPGVTDGHPDADAAVHDAAALCRALGHETADGGELLARHVNIAEFFAALADFVAHAVDRTVHGLGAARGRRVEAHEVEPLTWALAERGARLNARAVLRAVTGLQRAQEGLTRVFETPGTVLLTPTLSAPPVTIGTFDSRARARDLDGLFRDKARLVTFPPLFNVGGQPAVNAPLWWSGDGLPIGVQLATRRGDDDVLIALAAQLERARPWASRVPPLFADR